jgi:hypothetical protein
MGKSHPEMGGGEFGQPAPRSYCLPGCNRLDGHDGRMPGACMENGTVLIPGPLDLVHRHPDIPVPTPLRDIPVVGVSAPGYEWPLSLPPAAIRAFDLTAPAKMLGARIRCRDASCDVRELALGAGEDGPRVIRYGYGACEAGCCEAHVTVDLRVPCESFPHCQSCECGSDHRITLSKSAMGELKALLP